MRMRQTSVSDSTEKSIDEPQSSTTDGVLITIDDNGRMFVGKDGVVEGGEAIAESDDDDDDGAACDN